VRETMYWRIASDVDPPDRQDQSLIVAASVG
jgi:hypothetical protein